MTALVAATGLSAGYDGRAAVSDVTFAAEPGESIGVLGPNGGGKTTLFRALLGDLPPLAGRVEVAGRVAYVAQTERTRLDFPVTALDVATMGALARSPWWRPPRRSDRHDAGEALGRVGLAGQERTRFGELSGGQRQRVLLARALVQGAAVLLLDEPLSGVDRASAEGILSLFDDLRDEGRTLLVATHDIEAARRLTRVLCLNGRQVAFGPPRECLDDPAILEATYGSEIVVLGGPGGPLRAVAVQHHEH